MSKKILLIGGTGFIGKHVLKILIAAGHQVRVLSRSQAGNNGAQYIKGSLLDINSLQRALEGQQVIIQTAQFSGHPVERPWKGAEYTYQGLDGQGTENVTEALKFVGSKPEQYIYVSGAGAGAEHNYSWLKAKKRAEAAIKASGVPYTIFRPSWVYGQGDQSMSKFVLFAKYLPFFPVIGDGTAPVNPLWVEDLAQIIAKAVANPEASNKTIEPGSPEINMALVAKTVLRAVGEDKPILYHPKPLMKLAGLFAQFVPGSPLSPKSVDFLMMDVHLQNLQQNVFGVQIKNLEEGLRSSGLVK
jgi:uncharacterized protein YbjT (DUF2867 family)